MSISQKQFGIDLMGRPMTLYTLTNKSGASVSLLDFGAHLVSVKVPDKDGKLADVCLGYDTLEEYDRNGCYVGATIGRYGNRIGGAKFTLNGKDYTLFQNDGKNNLHGGREGFDKKWWQGQVLEAEKEDTVLFTYVAHDGEEGFPGKMKVQVAYSFDDDCRLTIRYLALSDKDTLCNLTNHSFFNLAGEGDVRAHTLWIDSDTITDVDTALIPTGEFLNISGTPLDFDSPAQIGAGLDRMAGFPLMENVRGYDVNYVLRGEGLRKVAALCHPASGREMDVYTTEPGIQIYSGQGLNQMGHNGMHYGPYAGVAMETQHYPDSPNHDHFPTTTLKAGETYSTTTIYHFTVK